MKKTFTPYSILITIICAINIVTFQSCSDDNESLEDKQIDIEYIITCDNADAQMHIDANGLEGAGLYVKSYYKNTLKTKDYFAVVDVRCDDPKALISVEVYINKQLKAKKDGNSTVFISERLKGKGPYLE